jgi:L-alanine-DL-glutamate epimerase-like enolase superfamily enzyme
VLSSAPRIVKVTVTPILISDPPLFNFLGAHQPYTPGSIVETETSDGVVGIGETYGSRDHPDEKIAAVHALVPASLHDQPACTNGSTGCRSATTATTSRPCGASTPTGRSHRSRGGDPGRPEPHP